MSQHHDDPIRAKIDPKDLLDNDLQRDPSDLKTTPIDLHRRGNNEVTRPVGIIPLEKTQLTDMSSLMNRMTEPEAALLEPVGDPDATLPPDYAIEASAKTTDLDAHAVDDADIDVVSASAVLAALHSEDEPDTQVNQVIPQLPVMPPPAPSEPPPKVSTPPVLGDAANAAKRPANRNPEPGPAISGESRTENGNGSNGSNGSKRHRQRPLTKVFDPPSTTVEPQVATLKGNADIKTAKIPMQPPATPETTASIDALWGEDVTPDDLNRPSKVTQPTLKVVALPPKDVTTRLMDGAVNTDRKLSFTERHGVGMTVAVLVATLFFIVTASVAVYMSGVLQKNNQNPTATLPSDAGITKSIESAKKTVSQAVADASLEANIDMSEEIDTGKIEVDVDQAPIPPVVTADQPPKPPVSDDQIVIEEEPPPIVLQTPTKTQVLKDCKPVVGLKVDKDGNVVLGQKMHDGKPVLACGGQKYVAQDVQCDNTGQCRSDNLIPLDKK